MSDDFVADLRDAARRNPISAALIGMGAAWMFLGSRPAQQVANLAQDWTPSIPNSLGSIGSTVKSGIKTVSDGVASGVESLRDAGSDVIERGKVVSSDYAQSASSFAGSLPDAGASAIENMRSNIEDLFRDQPIAVGLVGIAIGAGIAAAFPSSQLEKAYIGPTSDLIKKTVSETAAEQGERAMNVANDVIETVQREAEKQGLTLAGAKEAASDVTDKISRVVGTKTENRSA